MRSRYTPNSVQAWCPMDTLELYLRNRQHQPDLLRQHGWWDPSPIEYRFNAQGFRADEFTASTGTVFLGCSFTVGIGLPYEDTWVHQVSSALGSACWNLGQGAGSMDTCFRIAEYWIPRLRPTRVVIMNTIPARVELIDKDGAPHFYSAHHSDTAPSFLAEWLNHDENIRLNYLKNSWAICQLCDREQVPFYEWNYNNLLYNSNSLTESWTNSLARDLVHPGVECHHRFAEKVIAHIKSAENIQ